MGRQTTMQRILRPALNFLIERFFPRGAFFGNDYLRAFDADTKLADKWGTTEMACVMFVTSKVRKSGFDSVTFEASDVTDRGTLVGSWKVTIEKVEEDE